MRKLKNIIRDFGGHIYYKAYKRFKNFGNRCLIYHAFGSKIKHDTYGISINIKKFESHIKYLHDHYNVESITNFSSNDLVVSISIDDGYKDTLDAINILAKYDTPFTLFVTTENINKDIYLSHDDIHDISTVKNSVIGTHGFKHSKLGTMSYNNQHRELYLSKKKLEEIVNKEISLVSYPHGSYNNDTLKIVSKIGYKYAACSKKGFNNANTNNYLLQRSEIIASDNIVNLNRKIKGYYDYY